MSDLLRVAMVTHYPADPARIVGGVQAVSARLVDELRRVSDLELHVIHCHSDIQDSRTVRQGQVTLHFIAQTRRRVIPNMATGIRHIVRLLREVRPDVVHAHGPSLAVAALRAGWNPIWTIHGVPYQEARLSPRLFDRLSFLLTRHYERQALRHTNLITAASPYVVRFYQGQTGARWEVIEYPAPRAYFDLPRQPLPGRLLMPASLIPLKDPVTLVRAIAEVRRTVPYVQAHLTGSLPDSGYVRRVREEIARSGLAEAVLLLGLLDAERLEQEYGEAQAVVLPSRQEVAPMAIVEAMAAGIPVVAAAVGGIPEMVEEGVTGYRVPPGDPGALASALTAILTRPDQARAMGMAAQAAARARFHPARTAGSYLALYRAAAVAVRSPEPEGGKAGDGRI